ncbi:MAG TPA: hypothetical protein VFD32_00520, partial [Dehalococcoidia bacterium]|nr:hypothetical protein [Dehalococcoidia bacterium]
LDLNLPPDLSCGGDCDGGRCDPLTATCGQCSPGNDTCPDGQRCTRAGGIACNQPTVTGCNPGTICMPSDTSCGSWGCCRMPCSGGEFPCPVGLVCVQDGDCVPSGCCVPPPACAPGCKSDGECQSISDGGGSLARCCNGQCLDGTSDDFNCGSCGYSCAAVGATCCCGACSGSGCSAILQTSPLNCGSCGHVCGSGQVCVNGNCQ